MIKYIAVAVFAITTACSQLPNPTGLEREIEKNCGFQPTREQFTSYTPHSRRLPTKTFNSFNYGTDIAKFVECATKTQEGYSPELPNPSNYSNELV